MLIRFKNNKNDVDIYNTENIRELRTDREIIGKREIFFITIIVNDKERCYRHFSTREQVVEALDKIYDAYAVGARAVTIETDDI